MFVKKVQTPYKFSDLQFLGFETLTFVCILHPFTLLTHIIEVEAALTPLTSFTFTSSSLHLLTPLPHLSRLLPFLGTY